MLQNAYLLAKIGADTAENERNSAKNWQLPYGRSAPRPRPPSRGAPPRGPARPGRPGTSPRVESGRGRRARGGWFEGPSEKRSRTHDAEKIKFHAIHANFHAIRMNIRLHVVGNYRSKVTCDRKCTMSCNFEKLVLGWIDADVCK